MGPDINGSCRRIAVLKLRRRARAAIIFIISFSPWGRNPVRFAPIRLHFEFEELQPLSSPALLIIYDPTSRRQCQGPDTNGKEAQPIPVDCCMLIVGAPLGRASFRPFSFETDLGFCGCGMGPTLGSCVQDSVLGPNHGEPGTRTWRGSAVPSF